MIDLLGIGDARKHDQLVAARRAEGADGFDHLIAALHRPRDHVLGILTAEAVIVTQVSPRGHGGTIPEREIAQCDQPR